MMTKKTTAVCFLFALAVAPVAGCGSDEPTVVTPDASHMEMLEAAEEEEVAGGATRTE